MAPHYFIQGLFALAGLIALLAAILNWKWFFEAQNAQFIVRNVGKNVPGYFMGFWESY